MEQDFQVIYVEIEEADNKIEVLLQLSTIPPIICRGEGEEIMAAKNHAARSALDCLKILTKWNKNTFYIFKFIYFTMTDTFLNHFFNALSFERKNVGFAQ